MSETEGATTLRVGEDVISMASELKGNKGCVIFKPPDGTTQIDPSIPVSVEQSKYDLTSISSYDETLSDDTINMLLPAADHTKKFQ